jgi:hypothetical protein
MNALKSAGTVLAGFGVFVLSMVTDLPVGKDRCRRGCGEHCRHDKVVTGSAATAQGNFAFIKITPGLVILNSKEVRHENVKRTVAYGICWGCNAAKRTDARAGQHAAVRLRNDERWERPDDGVA